jgi:hypothetical protein
MIVTCFLIYVLGLNYRRLAIESSNGELTNNPTPSSPPTPSKTYKLSPLRNLWGLILFSLGCFILLVTGLTFLVLFSDHLLQRSAASLLGRLLIYGVFIFIGVFLCKKGREISKRAQGEEAKSRKNETIQQQRKRMLYQGVMDNQIKGKVAAMIVFSLWLIMFGGQIYYKESYVYSKWIKDESQILRINSFEDNSGEQKFKYALSYEYDGKTYTKENTTRSKPKFRVGDRLPIKINPKDFDHYRRDDGDGKKFGVNLIIFGLIFTSILSFFFFRKKKKGDR